MAKNQVKKTSVKKSGAKKTNQSKAPAKKSSKSLVAKKTVKKELTDKERAFREANLIANSEKKKKTIGKRPKKTATTKETLGLLEAVIEGMREKKAKNITVLNLKNIENRVTDYFVVCDADSNTHVNSIADSIEEVVEKLSKERAYHTEGHQNGEWILIDYINVVAHIFLREVREHYNLEGLWGDAEITTIEE